LLGAAGASAQPAGGTVVAGQAQISSSGATTSINQSSAKAIINWQNFSVGAGASVQFNQPNASAITLNRVTGAGASAIDGSIRANGQVWLLNPNGVLFGNGAIVNVGGLLATTSDIANQDFLEGRYNFSGGQAGIVNNGRIKAQNGGAVVLSAPNVVNNGLIRANTGHVVLGGTDTFTVDFNGDHLLSYAVGASSQSGKVINAGKISAVGGQVLLTARAAAGMQDAVINNTGMIEATTSRSVNGEIILDAGDGAATSSGTLDASGKAAGQTGGTVKVLGGAAVVSDNAVIDVSGNAGGGTVLIGGNFHGAGPEQDARSTNVGKAVIKANAIQSGNGGKVAVWSNGLTSFAGIIDARGGAAVGNGGQVETSGHALSVDKAARVSTAAAAGIAGDWLLDPDNIIIATGGSAPPTGQTFSTTGTVTIDPNSIAAALVAGSNVVLQAGTDITVNNAVTANTNLSLELDAGRSIILNASLTNLGSTGGSIILYAGNPNATGGSQSGASITAAGGVSLTANTFGLAVGTTGGGIGASGSPLQLNGTNGTTSIGVQINTSGGDVFLNSSSPTTICNCVNTPSGGTFLSNIGGVNLGTGNFTLTSAFAIGQNFGIKANNLNLTATGSFAQINLTDTGGAGDNGNDIGGVARFNATGNVTFINEAIPEEITTDIGASTVGGSLTVNAPNSGLILGDTSGTVAVAGSTTLTSNVGSITQTIPLTSAGLSASVGNGGIFLTNSANAVNGTATFQVPFDGGTGAAFTNSVATTLGASSIGAGTFSVMSAAGLNVAGNIAAPGSLTLQASGTITQASNGIINTPSAFLATQNVGDSIFLSNASNIIGSAVIFAGTTVSLFDSGNLTLLRLQGTTGSTSIPSGAVIIQDNGNLTLASSASGATASAGAIAVFHASGSILGGTGTAISSPSLALISDTGSIGTTGAPLNIAANLLAARTSGNGAITLSATPVSGTALTLTTITSGQNGNISNVNISGLNAGSGNIQIAGNGAMSFSGNGITANNLRLTGFTTINAAGFSAGSFSASASGAINVSSPSGILINNLSGGAGIQTPGVVTLNALGTITQASGAAGGITAGGLTASVNTSGGFGILLGDGATNAVGGSVTLNAPGNITFYNSVNTNVFRANYIPAQTAVAALSVDIEAFGASNPTLTVGSGVNQNGTSISGNTVTLRGVGGIFQSGTGAIAGLGSNVLLLSNTGSIGTATAPLRIQAGGSVLASTVNQDINLAFKVPAGVTNPMVQLGLPTSTTGFSAGTGNINISAAGISIFANNIPITANALNILSSANVSIDDAEVKFLAAAASGGGSIDISSVNGFQLNNLFGGPAISTTGDLSLSASVGTITQAGGASGAMTAGTFSSFAVGGNNFNNPANAISGNIEIGSLANTTLVNSLTTNLVVALVSGTFTVQSAGDLVIVTGPTIAGLSAASAKNGTSFKGTGDNNNNDNGNGEIRVSGTTVVSAATLSQYNGNIVSTGGSGDGIVLAAGGSFINNAGATALLLPNGARFLIYSADPAKDVFGGLKTTNGGIFGVSYPAAVTATGNRYVFSVASSPDTDFLGSTGLTAGTSTAAAPVLVGYVAAIQPPPRSLAPPAPLPPLGDLLAAAPLPPPPPPPLPPPPVQSPLTENNAEQPTSSDQSTSQVADSLDGSHPAPIGAGHGTGTIVPKMLVNAPPPVPPPTDISALSSFGNSALWQ